MTEQSLLLRMEEKPSHLTQRLLQLTLEIVYLLTGENYIAVKLCNSLVAPSLKEMHSILTEAPPPSLIPEKKSNKKFQEVTEEIIELLTREEPCQLYEAAMMEEEPPLTSPDGSRKRNPPERCPRPLYPQDSAQEEHSTPQEDQEEELNVAEVKEEAEEEDVRGEEHCAEEEISPQRSTDSGGSADNRLHFKPAEEDDRTVKSEMKEKEESGVRGEKWSAEDGLCPELGTAGQPGSNNMEELHFFISADGKIEADVTEDSPGESPLSPNLHPVPHGEVLSSGPSRHESKEHRPVKTCISGDELWAEEDFFPQIGADGPHERKNMEENLFISGDGRTEDEDAARFFSGETSAISDLQFAPYGSYLSRHGESFPDSSHLVTSHENYRKFPSSKGGRCLSQRAKHLTHKQVHPKETPYICSKCGKGFSLKEDLLKHFQFHAGDRLYLCSYCRKPFLGKFCLERHELIHTGYKPYSCSVCGIRFTQKANLARHERTHTGEKPFSCPKCGKCYTRKARMLTHWQSHK